MRRAKGERLSVWMYGRHVADLSLAKGRLNLRYTAEALAAYDANTPLISVSLPLLPRDFRHDQVHPFFDGLLPEGEARRMLAYDFRLQEDDTFGLLGALGRDCAGALVILPEGAVPPGPAAGPPVPIPAAEVAQRLRQLDIAPLGVDERIRISLAGVQYKLVLSRLASGEWALPVEGLPSTHILKRAHPRFEHMVANEAFCMAIGRHLGMLVADASVVEFPEPVLVVTRYDRERSADDSIRRIHQEDLAQALGIEARAKYQERGGPSLKTIAGLLRNVAGGTDDLERLLDVTLLNMVIGNADAHAKNVSLLHHEPGEIRLAPAYDLMSTAWYPQADVRPAMSINGKTSIHEITTTDVIHEAATWGLNGGRAISRVALRLSGLLPAIDAAAIDVPSVPSALVAMVRDRANALIATMPESL